MTQAFVESLMRATDGTFAANLDSVFQHIQNAGLDKPFKWDFVQTVSVYCSRNATLTKDHLNQTILKIFEGQEGIEMLETIPVGILQEGIAIGEARGEAKGIAIGEAKGIEIGEIRGEIKATLRFRFGGLSAYLAGYLSVINDLPTLTKLAEIATTCATLDEFAAAMK